MKKLLKALKRKIKKSKPYRKLLSKAEAIILPGFNGVPLLPVLHFFYRGLKDTDLNTRASAIAFNFFLALFPAVIFFFTLIAYIPIKDLDTQVLGFLGKNLPNSIYATIEETILEIINIKQGGLLSIGFLMAIFFSSNAVDSFITTFNKYTHSVESRAPMKRKLISIALTGFMSALVIVTIIISTIGTFLIKWFKKVPMVEIIMVTIIISTIGTFLIKWFKDIDLFNDKFTFFGLFMLQTALTISFIYILISALYFYGPAKKRKWAFFNPGSTLAVILSLVTTYVFSFYVTNFSSYNKLYGSLGTLIVVMLLIYFNSMIILLGFELNVSIDKAVIEGEKADLAKLKNIEQVRENTFKTK